MSHHSLLIWLLTAILYGGTPAVASAAASPAAAPEAGLVRDPPSGAKPAASSEPATLISHIALLLPVSSGVFARPAAAVESGFLTAARAQGWAPLPIRTYPVTDDREQIISGYRQAVAAGAQLVVGPLTRSSVTALATSGSVAVPTLALNVPDSGTSMPPNLYTLSLHVEDEARQLARLAYGEGHVNALTIEGGTPLLKRMHRAFVQEFTRLGGKQVAEYAYTGNTADLDRIRLDVARGVADMVFLALDYQRVRMIRPYLDLLALYATSQAYPGGADPLAAFELANVRFLDMPWLLQPDHPAVMIYPRRDYGGAVDLDRLYALGIDAFRVAQELLNGRTDVALDGVSGRITLGRDHCFVRELVSAQFSGGKLLVSGDAQP